MKKPLEERKCCWMYHKYREYWEYCPLCNAPIRWQYEDEGWVPLDREPIRFVRGIEGKMNISDGRHLLDYCMIYKDQVQTPRMGLLPHVYSCHKLKGFHGIKIER